MVEPVTITAIALLAAYLKGATEEAGKRTLDGLGEAGAGALRRVYELIRRGVAGDEFSEQALARVEEKPGDERRQRTLQDVVDEIAESDPAFARELGDAVRQASEAAGDSIRIDHSGAVAIRGNVTLEGENVAGRDLHLGKR